MRGMFILVATDGSAHATVALTYSAHLARALEEPLVILTIVKKEEEVERARHTLQSAEFIIQPYAVKYETKLRRGHPAEEIVREAEEKRHHLAVVGEKQHQGLFTRFVLGSTALRVVEHAPCPVVVVKGEIGPIKRVLICDSGAPEARIIDRATTQLPRLFDGSANVTILHVMSHMSAAPGIDGHFLRADAEGLMQEHAPEGVIFTHDLAVLAKAGVQAVAKVRHGRVVDEVLTEAREGDYDLIILGAHAGTGWRRILLDDIAHQLVIGLDRPALVIR
jgi:nucleotide-binding universal stress UspA family protein